MSIVMDPFTVDVRPFLPDTWQMEVETFAAHRMFPVAQDEGGPGSIGYGPTAAIEYETALKPELAEAMPWMTYLHEQALPVLLNLNGLGGRKDDPRASGELTPIKESHGFVMNVFTRGKKGIEWHRDGADVLINVVFSTSVWNEETGGRFLVHDGRQVTAYDLDTPGVGLAVRTGDLPHTVEPITEDHPRVSFLFSYTNPVRHPWREQAYNEHFYAGREA